MARVVLLALMHGAAAAQSIVPFAGGGANDGRPATAAGIRLPSSVVTDSEGNVYFADRADFRVRKLTAATGKISTVAGNGYRGFAGDLGPATAAQLDYPTGVAMDKGGNIYVADYFNYRIRRVDANSGLISTFAGQSGRGFAGDGGPATAAKLFYPTAIAFDGDGNLYLADRGNHRIRRISAETGVISTVAGNGSVSNSGDGGPATAAGLNNPSGVALDTNGNIYIADTGNNRVRRVDRATGRISTIAGNGDATYGGDGVPATTTGLSAFGIDVDARGDIYIADYINDRIRKVSSQTGLVSTVVGRGTTGFSGDGGSASACELNTPYAVLVEPDGSIYVGDAYNSRVRRVSADTGIIATVAGNGEFGLVGDGGPATAAGFSQPEGLTLDRTGNLVLADFGDDRVRKVDKGTGTVTTIAGIGALGQGSDVGPATSARLANPQDVAFDSAGNLYIANYSDGTVRRVDASSGAMTIFAGKRVHEYSGDGGPATAAGLSHPYGLAIDASDNLYIGDSWNHRIRRVDAASRIITTVAGSGTEGFSGDGGSATEAKLAYPHGISLDAAGNLFIADTINHAIRNVSAGSSVISTVAGTGVGGFSGDRGPATAATLSSPYSVVVDRTGQFWVADTYNHRIRRVERNGVITTVAGNGLNGITGIGGPATAAALSYPYGVTVDAAGNIYIADAQRVSAVYRCVNISPPTLVMPTDGAQGVSSSARLEWSSVPGAFRYDVYLDEQTPPTRLVAADITITTFSLSSLTPGKAWYWRVVAKGDPFCTPVSTAASEIRAFSTGQTCEAPGIQATSATQPNR